MHQDQRRGLNNEVVQAMNMVLTANIENFRDINSFSRKTWSIIDMPLDYWTIATVQRTK